MGWRGGEGRVYETEAPRERVSVVMVPAAPLLIKDGWLVGSIDGWRSRDAILICAIIMCTQSPGDVTGVKRGRRIADVVGDPAS